MLLRDALRRAIVVNFWLKLMSVIGALLLWFAVSSEHAQRDVVLYNVPVRVRRESSDLLVTGLAYRVVDVRVRGSANQIARLKPEDLSILVDVSRLTPGRHILTLDERLVRRPAGIEVLRIDPPTLPIEVQREITREVPIRPRLDERSLPSNYMVTGYAVKPERAHVTGPEAWVNRLEEIPTRAIVLGGVNSSLTVTVPLEPVDSEALRITPREATVTVHVEEVMERRFPQRPILLAQAVRRRIVITPQVVDVLVRGPRSTVQALGEHEIIATLPEEVLQALATRDGEQEVAPLVRLPTGSRASVVRCEPERVRVRWR